MNLKFRTEMVEDIQQMCQIPPRSATFKVRKLASIDGKCRRDFKLGFTSERTKLRNYGTELFGGTDLSLLPRI